MAALHCETKQAGIVAHGCGGHKTRVGTSPTTASRRGGMRWFPNGPIPRARRHDGRMLDFVTESPDRLRSEHSMVRYRVIFLPGGVVPAGPAYAALLEALGDDVDARVQDLELYAPATPPPD